MNNLNKFTKAELISKFKGLENKNSNPSIFTKIFSYILLFKNLILKITLITFIIKWIKNYSIIRKIWHVISTIASTLLGISFIDIYGFDLIAWIRESQIYQWFSELIVTPKVIEKKSAGESIPSNMKETYPNATRSESDHEIIKRFKEIIYKESEPIVEDELNQENTAFYKNKYFIIGALTISVLVSWYYLDEIKTGYGSVIDWLNSFRRGSSWGTSGIDTNESTTPIAKNIKSELNRLFPENPPKDIELIDNTQTIASSSKGNIMDDPTKVYSSSPTSMEQYFTEDKDKGIDVTNLSKSEINRRLIENATGNSLNRFQDESSLLLARLNQFTTLHETGNFPSEVLKVGMYNTLKARLVALSVDGGILYDNWLKESGVSEKVYNFFDLKDNLTNKVDEQHPDTYNDVALSTVQEQEAWSSGPNSSIHSPYVQQELIADEGQDVKVETPKNETKSL